MKFYVFHFGQNGKYLPLLERIRTTLAATGSRMELRALICPQTPKPDGWECETVDPAPWLAGYCRTGRDGAQWDYKACMLMAKCAEVMSEPAVFLDSDNVIHGDPLPLISALPHGVFALGPDGGARTIQHPAFGVVPMLEHSTSVMVMPADSRALCAKYRELWDSSTEPTHYLLEQRTWALVCHAVSGTVLPRSMAYSTRWGKAVPSDTLIEHPHGPRKWVGLG